MNFPETRLSFFLSLTFLVFVAMPRVVFAQPDWLKNARVQTGPTQAEFELEYPGVRKSGNGLWIKLNEVYMTGKDFENIAIKGILTLHRPVSSETIQKYVRPVASIGSEMLTFRGTLADVLRLMREVPEVRVIDMGEILFDTRARR